MKRAEVITTERTLRKLRFELIKSRDVDGNAIFHVAVINPKNNVVGFLPLPFDRIICEEEDDQL